MMNHTKTFVFLLLLLIATQSALTAQYSLDTIRADFNNDKIIDTLIDDFSSGGSLIERQVTIVDGKTQEKFILSNSSGYSSSFVTIKIPDNLLLKKNKPFLDTLKSKVIFYKKRASKDATLQWLLSASLGGINNVYYEGREHPYFGTILNPQAQWETYKPFVPEPYYTEITGDTLQKLIRQSGNNDRFKEASKGYLVYFSPRISNTFYSGGSLSLDSLEPIAKNDRYEIYKTAHSVYAKKGNKHKWLFISDSRISPSIGFLNRFPSINKVELIDNYLIIHQNTIESIYNIIIVNIETQRIGFLSAEYEPSHKNWTDEGGMDTFEIIENQLVFSEYGVQELHKIPLKELFKNLDRD